MNTNIIDKAIEAFGSQARLAAACGVTQAAVSNWRRGSRVSAEKAILIERATKGAVKRADIRPDVFALPESW